MAESSPDADQPENDKIEPEDQAFVKRQFADLKNFLAGLDASELKNGAWFAKLINHSISSYVDKVDAAYFRNKYPGVPADLVVDQRIRLAARYAALGGGLSASAYTGLVAATIGTAGGASAATIPVAAGTMVVDAAFISQLQLRLAYDIAILYRVPLDLDDPEDLWKFVRIAMAIKGGEAAGKVANKAVPAVVRPLVKRYLAGPTLNAVKGLPVVGKFLLQRNVIKVGIPLVGVPLAVVINRWSTSVAGNHAKAIYREEAAILETVENVVADSRYPALLLWVGWLVIDVDGTASEAEAVMLTHLVRLVEEHHGVVDQSFTDVIQIRPEQVWAKMEAAEGDLGEIYEAAAAFAVIDGATNTKERKLLGEIRDRCRHA